MRDRRTARLLALAATVFVGCIKLEPGDVVFDAGALEVGDTGPALDADVTAGDATDAPPQDDTQTDTPPLDTPPSDTPPSDMPPSDTPPLDVPIDTPVDADAATPDASTMDVPVGADADVADVVRDVAVDVMTCASPGTLCGSSCVDTSSNVSNCGACGRACQTGQVCALGSCACPLVGQTFCAGLGCINTTSDATHCGGCSVVCPAGQSCVSGMCMCPTGLASCAGAGCRDLQADSSHCGACGSACAPGQSCARGVCVCPSGQTSCGAAGCVNVQTDTSNCGACGRACAAGQLCSSGACVCPSGLSACGSGASLVCVNRQTDNANCGACGTSCASAFPNAVAACVTGACRQTACLAGFSDCILGSGAVAGCETSTATDANNCGACGNRCSFPNAAASCSAGVCRLGACNAGFADCDGNPSNGCEVNTASDTANCARCMNACSAPTGRTAICTAGVCGVGASCASGVGDCDGNASNGCEVTFNTDASNCGACGHACNRTNGSPTCAGGVCAAIACNSGFGNCDGDLTNGCESNLASSPSHCAVCGNRCSFSNAAASCVAGLCTLGTCNAGFGDCDSSRSNGCEVNVAADVANCGSCGNRCAFANATASCASSTCQMGACNAGFADCNTSPIDGCETSLSTSNLHCGRCGAACPSGLSCVAGSCCPAGQGLCSGSCIDFTTNTNCGACGRVCPCGSGACLTTDTLATGNAATCALMSDGTARCWGNNTDGQLGRGPTSSNGDLPGEVLDLTGVVDIRGNANGYFLALLDDRTVHSWGNGTIGALGAAVTSRNYAFAIVGLTNAVEIGAWAGSACARLLDGTVRCWGSTGTTPTAVSNVTDAVQLASGGGAVCARRTGGGVRCWGSGLSGALGNGGTASSAAAVDVIGVTDAADLVGAGVHLCVRTTTGAVKCWGGNTSGETSEASGTRSSTPVTVPGISDAVQVVAGQVSTCARRSDGTVWCWGGNGSGQLGDGTNTGRTTPAAVLGISTAVDLVAFDQRVCARLADGTARCWGDNALGQLGDGTVTPRNRPVPVMGLASVARIALGNTQSCARMTDGTMRCWGENASGEIGDGTRTQRLAPVVVRWP